MLRRRTNNNGRNYAGTKDDERGSIEVVDSGGSISAKTCNEHFNPEVPTRNTIGCVGKLSNQSKTRKFAKNNYLIALQQKRSNEHSLMQY